MRHKRVNKFLRIVLVVAFLATQFLSASFVQADAPPELASGDVYYSHPGTNAYMDAHVSNLTPDPNAFGISNGTFNAWCVAADITISTGSSNVYSTKFYNPSDGTWLDDASISDPNGHWDDINWKAITWILNNKGSLSKDELQEAIWYFSNNESIDGDAETLINSMPPTLADCETYSTQALVAWNGNNKQLLIIEYAPEKFPVLYDNNDPSATGTQDDTTDPYQPGVTVTVLDENDMALANHTFNEWNTESDGTGTPYSESDTFRMPGEEVTLYAQWKFAPNADVSLVKTANPTSGLDVGETVTYTLVAKNIGNVPIYDVLISDLMLDATLTNNAVSELAVNGTLTATGTYVVTEDDIWNGSITNYALVEAGSTPEQEFSDLGAKDNTTVTTIKPDPSISLTKVADKSSGLVVDEVVTYSFTIKNTGNVTLYNVEVTDAGVTFDDNSNSVGTLAPGASEPASAKYTITESDVAFGSYRNDADVEGWTYYENKITAEAFAVVETEVASNKLTISKDLPAGDPANELEVGDIVEYTLTVTNPGNITAYGVRVTDSMLGIDTLIGTLAPGAHDSVTGYHTVNVEDLWAGSIYNQAFVTGYSSDDLKEPDLDDDDDLTVYPVATNAAIEIVKTIVDEKDLYSPGDTISYQLVVTNKGNVTIYYTEIVDNDLDALTGVTSDEILDPTDTYTAYGTYVVQVSDIEAGPTFDNTATVSGIAGLGAHDYVKPYWEVSDDDTASANLLTPRESVGITKVADAESVMVGATITYTIQVSNTGNVPIWGVYADAMLGIETNFHLGVGESTIPVTGTYVTDRSDLYQVVNTAVVYLDTEYIHVELGTPDASATATVAVTELPPSPTPPPPTQTPPPPVLVPNISVTITPDATLVEVGTEVNFTMVVTNTGQTVLRDVVVNNADLGYTTTIPILYVMGSETFSAPKTLNDVGNFIPTVTATGNSTGTLVTSVSDTDVTTVEVYEIVIPPTPTPPPLDPPDNPETGTIPFDAYSVSGLLAMGAGIFALVSRKKETNEEDED